jgi:LDH2 family malate/lactate/ureidoglycolate dehydrogenase
MKPIIISVDQLRAFCEEVFCGFGFNKQDSAIITNVLILIRSFRH